MDQQSQPRSTSLRSLPDKDDRIVQDILREVKHTTNGDADEIQNNATELFDRQTDNLVGQHGLSLTDDDVSELSRQNSGLTDQSYASSSEPTPVALPPIQPAQGNALQEQAQEQVQERVHERVHEEGPVIDQSSYSTAGLAPKMDIRQRVVAVTKTVLLFMFFFLLLSTTQVRGSICKIPIFCTPDGHITNAATVLCAFVGGLVMAGVQTYTD